jgi:hypothetical protein
VDHIDIVKITRAITYKPDWRLHAGLDEDYFMMWWSFTAPDATTGIISNWSTEAFYFPQHLIRDEEHVVRLAFRLALQAEEHECREFFQYNGKRPFNPHTNLIEAMA